MRTIAPRRQDQASLQERQRAAGLVLLLLAVVAGFVLQVVLLPREAQAVGSRRLTSAEQQVAAFAPPAAAPRAEYNFLQPRTRPSRLKPVTRSRLGLAQPLPDQTARSSRPQARPAPALRTEPEIHPAQAVPDNDTIGVRESANERRAAALSSQSIEPADQDLPVEPAAAEAAGDSLVELRIPGVRNQDRMEARLTVLGPADAREGELVTYAVSVEGAREIAHSPVRITFDPQVLEFVEAQEGTMLSSDGAPTRFQVGHGGGEGVIDVLVSRVEPGRGLTGSGVLFTVTFLAHAPGETPLLVAGSTLLDAAGRRVPFLSEETALSVRP